MDEPRPGGIRELVDSGTAVERGTAVGVMRRSRPAGLVPADAILVGLVAEARRHGDTVPSLGATARKYSRSSLGLHTRAKAMHLRTVAAVGLEGTLGHRTVLIRESLPCGQVLSIADSVQIRQSLPLRRRRSPAVENVPSLRLKLNSLGADDRRPRSNARSLSPRRIFIFACDTSSHASGLCRQVVVNSPQKHERPRRYFARLHKQWCNTTFW